MKKSSSIDLNNSSSNLQKKRKGFNRLWHAFIYSLQGLKYGLNEKAFRLEITLAIFLIPTAFLIGRSWLEIVALISSTVLVLITELINSAIETTVDRISIDWHHLAKKAKDLGSAAVFLSLLLCIITWLMAIVSIY